MTTVFALSGPIPKAGVIVAVLLAAIALVTHERRLRAAAVGAALVLTPILLLADIWHTSQLDVVRRHPGPAAVAALVAVIALVVLALLMLRWPLLMPLLAIAALPFRIPIAVSGSTSNLLVPLYAVVASGALAYIIATVREEPQPTSPWAPALVERLLAIVIVLYAIQATYSDDFDKALQQIVFFYVPFALLFVLLAQTAWTPRLLRWSLLLLIGLALVFCLIGYVEYATRHLFVNPKLLASNDLHAYFRTNSVFFDPNIFGRFLVIVMLTVAAVMLHVRRDRLVGAGALVLVALWVGLILTLSQSSLVALLVGLATLAALQWGGRRTLVPVGVVVVIVAAVVLIVPGTVGINLHNLNNSSSGRVGLVQGGVDLFASAPIVGHGSGSFEDEYSAHHRREAAGGTTASHTIPITIAAEQGVVGLIAYVALLLAAFALLVRGAKTSAARGAVLAAFAALVVHTFFYAAFLEDPLTWTLLGVGAALAATPQPPAAERARARRAARASTTLPAA